MARAGLDDAIGGKAFSRCHQHPHVRKQVGRRDPAGLAILSQNHRAGGGLFEQSTDPLARPVPHHAVKDPSREQEEQQHHRAVKIGMGPAGRGFINAQAGCQQYADRNGHIHIGPAIAQRHRRRREKRAPGIGNHRDRDQRGEPVEQVAGDAGRTGPDADRQQHDVHHSEAGNGKRADQSGGAALFLGQRIVREDLRFKAQRLDLAPQLIVIQLRQMRHGDLFGREIDPRGDYAGFGIEAIFDFRDTAGAADRRDGKAGHQRLRRSAGEGSNGVHWIS